MKKYLCSFAAMLLFFVSHSQTAFWAFNVGSPAGAAGNDGGYAITVGQSGNVYVTGRFSGTMDLDPGPGVYNITSNGLIDIFVASYSASGAFNWGFGVGGPNNDGGYKIVVDRFENVIVCGFFQVGADFDPGTGVAFIPSAGGLGSTTVGEGFLAKYTMSGSFLWAKALGGTTVYDYSEGLAVDEDDNIYVSGEFSTSMTVAPGMTFLTMTAGPGYIIKYNPAGTVIWGHNFGQAGGGAIATAPRSLKVVNGHIYVGGQFKGTADFNPWGATPAVLTATGGFSGIDPFVAKYDTAGNFVFVRAISGTGNDDEIGSIVLDAAENIYFAGWTNSPSLIYDMSSPGTSTVSAPGGAGNYDVFTGKFNSSGVFQWGQIFGSPGEEISRTGIDLIGGSIYVPGWFSNTVDFDASAGVANLTSAGGTDMFLARYDLNGNYICAFRVGSPVADDKGYAVGHSTSGEIFNTGFFGGTGVDFDPTAPVLPLTSIGGSDIYLAKYDVCGSIIAASCDSLSIAADTVNACIGTPRLLTATLWGTNPIYDISWAPSSGMTGATTLTPTLTPTFSGWRTVTVRSVLPGSLVFNGDFSAGNTGFTSTHSFVSGPSSLMPVGVYAISSNPNNEHPGGASFFDHTMGTATGSMMAVNGATTSGSVWCQTIPVTPNTDYVFSGWFANWSGDPAVNLPQIRFEANGALLGSAPFTFSTTPGLWTKFSATWNSGTSTSVSLCINNYQTAAYSNDFAIDDIEFQKICVLKDSVYVRVLAPDEEYHSTDTVLCSSIGSVGLYAPSGYTYHLWSDGTTSAATSVPSSGVYWVRSSDTLCRTRVDTFHVTIVPMPAINLGNDTSFCEGGTITLSTYATADSLRWSTGASGHSISVSSTGVYWVTIDSNECVIGDTIAVTVKPVPNVNIGSDVVLCEGDSVLLTATSSAVSPTYLWNDGSTTSGIYVHSGGIYWVVVNDNGCVDRDTVQVDLAPVPWVSFSGDTTICSGTSISIGVPNDASMNYLWSTGATTSTISVSDAGVYSLTISQGPCSADFFKTVNVGTPPESFSLGSDTTICLGESIVINLPFDNVYWSTGTRGKSLTVTESGLYSATTWNACGVARDTIEVKFVKCNIWFPSAFTPNADGRNDIARVVGTLGYYKNFSLSIYNRWGERVFYTEDIYEGWDGTYKGVPQDLGTFFYMIFYTFKGERTMLKGDITLIR